MQVKDVMTADPACCVSETTLQDVAKMMVDHDCGQIPIIDSNETKRPIGVITDRDIVCRTVAQGINPLDQTAADCLTEQCVTVAPDTSLEDCSKIMEQNKIRRVLVVDAEGSCIGIVAMADIALHAGRTVTAEVVKEVSEPTRVASAAGN